MTLRVRFLSSLFGHMMGIACLFFVFMVGLSCCNNPAQQGLTLEKGVSLALAQSRSERLSDVAYHLSFSIPTEKQDSIPSKLVLHFKLSDLSAPLYLDFKERSDKLKTLSINGQKSEINHSKEHLTLPTDHLQIGKNQIEIEFILGELSLNRNDDYLYTLLVPDRARTLFPCFDQPDIKAHYKLEITAPDDWQVLCGALETNRSTINGFTTHQFASTENISTYLFSFVAGKFEVAQKNPGAFDMTLLYRENDTAKIEPSLPAIFNLHQQSITYLEAYTTYPFPFQKMDFAAIPGFQYGGMEHVGAIQYREGTLFLDQTATENQKLRRAKLIAHETAHMWFGDLVTMQWFDDVWMKEVFANFMADKIINPAFPDIDHDLVFMTTHYPGAYAEDRTLGTNPIRQELDNLSDAGSLYGNIIYNKAPIMMRQLEALIGAEAFQEGIREYISIYAYGNAVWNDLVELLDKKTSVNLKKWSDIWVNLSGRPVFMEHIAYDDDGRIATFEIGQKAEDGNNGIWPQIFDIALIYPDTVRTLTVKMVAEKVEVPNAVGLKKPEAIAYNTDGMGYGVFPQDISTLKHISSLPSDLARGYMYINSYENSLNGTIPPESLFERYRNALRTEENELVVNLVTGYLNNIFWTYLTDEQRIKYQPLLERQLLAQLRSELPPNIKKTLFGMFQSIAYSDSGKKELYHIWNKETTINDLKLNEDDYTEMAMYLALYEHQNAPNILDSAEKAITNPDKLERFQFLLPSLSQDIAVRDTFFNSLAEERNREKESWVQTALGFLNHPLRQKEAIKHLGTSLELLDEIQRTGDIFFPKGWLNNTIGKYTSAKAYDILQEFLTTHPDLNPALVKKVLQASDDLRRVQEVANISHR